MNATVVLILVTMTQASLPPAQLGRSVQPLSSTWPRQCLSLEARWRLLAWRKPSFQVTPRAKPPSQDELLETARDFLGSPYIWGATGPESFDCSGFVNRVYAAHGYDLPRTSREIFKVGVVVPRDQLRPGDLLFFVSQPESKRITHIGMYADDGEIIHAVMGKGEVTYDRLGSRYYRKRHVGSRRFLAMPTGRYSNRRGLARANALIETLPSDGGLAQITGDPTNGGTGDGTTGDGTTGDGTTGDGGTGDGGTGDLLDDRLIEHVGEAPAFLARGFVKGAVSHVGPRAMLNDATEVGLRLGWASVSDVASLFVVPEFSYFGHDDGLRLGIAVPVQIPLGGHRSLGELARSQWNSGRDWARVLREVTYGKKESPLYLDLNRTASGSLGHGQIMRYYTPNIASTSLPHYILEPNALSLSADGFLPWGGVELFVGDLFAADVIGTLLFARPGVLLGSENTILRTLSVGLTYAIDPWAPFMPRASGGYTRRVVNGVGLDFEIKPIKTESIDWKFYIDGSALVYDGGRGIGGAIGTLVRTNISGKRLHVIRGRLEMRLSEPTFIPSYFDATYALNRTAAPVDEPGAVPLTKLGLLHELKGTSKRWGIFGEIAYQYARRGSFGVSYEDGGAISSVSASQRYSGRSLMFYARLRHIYLPRSSSFVSFYLAYHLRNFKSLTPIFGLKRSNEYLFVAVTYNPSSYLAVGAALRKAIDTTGSGGARFDGSIDATARFEF